MYLWQLYVGYLVVWVVVAAAVMSMEPILFLVGL